MLSSFVLAMGADESITLARRLGVPKGLLWHWLTQTSIPDLVNALNLSRALQIDLKDLYLGRKVPAQPTIQRMHYIRQPRRAGTRDLNALRESVREVASGPPLSLKSASEHLEVAPRTLRKHFPEESAAICLKFRQKRKSDADAKKAALSNQMLLALDLCESAGVAPTIKTVGKRIPKPGIFRRPENRDIFHGLQLTFMDRLEQHPFERQPVATED
jgi:hypothetical protein